MKKLLILSLALALSLSLAACGDGGGNTSGGGLGDITVGDSSNPSNNSGDSTSTPDPTQSTPGTSQQPSGSNEEVLIGEWYYEVGATNYYKFNDDGSFFYYQIIDSVMSSVNGKYTASNSRVFLTDLVYVSGSKLKDQILEYSSGADGEGVYLSMPPIKYISPDSDSEPYKQSIKFRPYK